LKGGVGDAAGLRELSDARRFDHYRGEPGRRSAFSTLIKTFTDSIITPLINAIAGGGAAEKGIGWTLNGQRIDLGAFIGALVYFIIFVAVIYFLIVVPYRAYMRKRGKNVVVTPWRWSPTVILKISTAHRPRARTTS
jgi:large-conductance mechanosensitive channel